MGSKLRVLPYVLLLAPFDFIVAFGILVSALCVLVVFWFKKHQDTRTQRPYPVATVIIVNWDGKHLLAECLPPLIESLKCAGGDHGILVVDNGSTDGSVQFIHENFPPV